MKKNWIRLVTTISLAAALFFSAAAEGSAATGRQMAENAIASLKATARTTTTRNIASLSWSWFEIDYYDETYPLTIDFV
ncbi:MAG: hypothetical protein EG828_13925, partial [Deltaproteobacteria bacterium]|nr:hypothetical protein [Deltaproteobacteria bacterium]